MTDKLQQTTDKSIYQWINNHQKVNESVEDVKYTGLLDHVKNLQLKPEKNTSPENILIVGAGEGRIEHKIISLLGLSNVELWAMDIVKPHIKPDGIINHIHWVSEISSDFFEIQHLNIDVLICLGTSRYFDNAIDNYESMFKCLNKDALVIVDFFELPPIRQASTKIMGDWLKKSWQTDPNETISSVVKLAEFSRLLSQQLGDQKIDITTAEPELGIEKGVIGLQQFIYESIFPFWYQDDFTDIEIAAQLLWSFMCTSCDNTLENVKQFSLKNKLSLVDIYDIYRDTHVLIARKS